MSTLTRTKPNGTNSVSALKGKRIESIDLLRGVVMIIMALDHVRNYFHHDAFVYSPTDLTQTSSVLFFTRFITHYCAPIFVFLAGISAYLYGTKRTKKELTYFLFTRGLWLVFAEFFIVGFGRTFNPLYPYLNLQVIWAIGISMIVLSALIYTKRELLLVMTILLIGAHNLLDPVHISQNFLWAVLHEPGDFVFGRINISVSYPVIPWIGVISLGYYLGRLYDPLYDPAKRKRTLLSLGFAAIALFFLLRVSNAYGDAAQWSIQTNAVFSLLSLMNVTKYPPSLLYVLVTLGPALIFLALAERPLTAITEKIAVFGRVPFFYYVLHIYFIHLLAMIFAVASGYHWTDMILTGRVNSAVKLKGYGFDLLSVYVVWAGLIFLLYPCCQWFDRYKRTHQSTKKWLSYL
jgi:uncharacterized membrane protein